jgi:hypothetical protein
LLDIFFYQREDLPIFCKNGFAEYVIPLAARYDYNSCLNIAYRVTIQKAEDNIRTVVII